MNQPRDFHAAILAGGQSRRFGSDKSLLTLGGEEVVARTVRILDACGFAKVWLVGGKPHDVLGAVHLPDDLPGLGPAGGIMTALRRASYGLFAVGCDMPALTAELVDHVLTAWDGRSAAAAPWRDERWEPLCALYLPEALAGLSRSLEHGPRDLQRVLTGLSAQRVAIPEALANALLNVNTPVAWREFLLRDRLR